MKTFTEAEIFQRMEEIKVGHWDYQWCALGFWEFTQDLMKNHNLETIDIKIIETEQDGDYTKDILFYNSNRLIETVSLCDYSPEAYETIEVIGSGWC